MCYKLWVRKYNFMLNFFVYLNLCTELYSKYSEGSKLFIGCQTGSKIYMICSTEVFFQFHYLPHNKTCLRRPLRKNTKNWFFKTHYRLMQVKSIAECSDGSILQYFWPSLSYHFPLIPLFRLFLSDRLRQVLLYCSSHFSTIFSKSWSK